MLPLGPIKRKDLIFYLKRLGFSDPISGGNHQFVQRGTLRLRIPNPHQSDISCDLLSRLLKQADISREEWEKL